MAEPHMRRGNSEKKCYGKTPYDTKPAKEDSGSMRTQSWRKPKGAARINGYLLREDYRAFDPSLIANLQAKHSIFQKDFMSCFIPNHDA
jgi:hypothetical protein